MLAPVTGSWDRGRIELVVRNLLANAVKYGEGKPIEVSVGADEGRARLVVRDHGIGIAPEDQVRIFERFERAAPRAYGGIGIGLWISRQVLELHSGSISRPERARRRGDVHGGAAARVSRRARPCG